MRKILSEVYLLTEIETFRRVKLFSQSIESFGVLNKHWHTLYVTSHKKSDPYKQTNKLTIYFKVFYQRYTQTLLQMTN